MNNLGGRYCPVCNAKMSIRQNPKVLSPRALAIAILTGVSLEFLISQSFEPRSLLWIVISYALVWIFDKLAWRLSLVCKSCEFDPVIYKTHGALARQLVENKLAEVKAKPFSNMNLSQRVVRARIKNRPPADKIL